MTPIHTLPKRGRNRLHRDASGVTAIEFGLLAPVLCLFLMGIFDLAHSLYVKTALEGVVQRTARDSTIEGMSPSALNTLVENQVMPLASNADLTFKRRTYKTFSQAAAARAEDWTDLNGDGRCNNNEPFVDVNDNKVWDSDGGNQGQGGAKDVTVYTVTMEYPRLFPVSGFIGLSPRMTVKATTVLRNQPYDKQSVYGPPTVQNCS